MFYLASTRFNNQTWNENQEYRKQYKQKVIYGSSVPINKNCFYNCLIFVVEMNNETNKIQGIGLIRNSQIMNYKVYNNSEYNLYVYKGNYWLSREDLFEINQEIVDTCETVLFKGKAHSKRLYGITLITAKQFIYWDYDFDNFKHQIKLIFKRKFSDNIHLKEITDFNEDEEFL